MAVIFFTDVPPTGWTGGADGIEDFGSIFGGFEGEDGCLGDGSNITPNPGGGWDIAGCTQSGFEIGIEVKIGQHYEILIEGTSPVVFTAYDSEGTLPFLFKPIVLDFAEEMVVLQALPGDPLFEAELGAGGFLYGLTYRSCSDPTACLVNMYFGVGEGTFISATIREIDQQVADLPEPSSAILLAFAVLGAALARRCPWRW